MTPRENPRKDDEPATKQAAAPQPGAAAAPTDPKKPAGYVFKFAPADPKNSFDFEDTADK